MTHNHTSTKVDLALAKIARDIGQFLVDSSVARSVLEQALEQANGGHGLRAALMEALSAADIRVVEDIPNVVIPDPSPEVEGPDSQRAAAPRGGTTEPDVDRLREVGIRRLRLDRDLRQSRLPKYLLTAEEEVALALLARPGGAKLEPGGFAQLKGEARAAADALVMHNLRLAHSVAQGYVGQGLEYDDLVQSAIPGLMRAVERFDPFSGFKFSTYATWWLRQSLSRSVANEGRLIRLPVHMWELIRRIEATRKRLLDSGEAASPWRLAQVCEVSIEKVRECLKLAYGTISLETPLEDGNATLGDLITAQSHRPEHVEVRGLFSDDVDRLLDLLADREAEVLRMRYVLPPYDAKYTLDEIGKVYGVSRERIRQIETKAMKRIRTQLEAEGYLFVEPEVDPKPSPEGSLDDVSLSATG